MRTLVDGEPFLPVQLAENIPVQTLLAGFPLPPSHRAEFQLEGTFVVGRDLYLDVDNGTHYVGLRDNSVSELSSSFMALRRGLLVRVTADPALAPVGLELLANSATEQFVIIIVDGVNVAKPPH